MMNNLSIRKMNEITKKKKKGFTLVELIIVIAIIAILAAIAIPKFGAIREDANVKADIATAKSIETATNVAIANGTVTVPQTSVTLTNVISTVPAPKSTEAVAAKGGFAASVDSDGVVTVTAGGIQVIPQVAHSDANPYSAAS